MSIYNERNYFTNKEIENRHDMASENSVKCQCGHSVLVTNKYKRVICNWCGCWVYASKKDEFRYKLKEKMKK